MCPSHGDETYVLDACVVIDFCGRTDNLNYLLGYVGDCGIVTSSVRDELRRQKDRKFSLLGQFLEHVDAGLISIVDPDLSNPDAARIVGKWSSQFGAGEVSSAAVAITHGWVFVSRDVAPMRQLRLSETIKIQTTSEVLQALVRERALSKRQADAIETAIENASTRRRRRQP